VTNIKLGIVMDPLDSINIKKDSTYAMIKEASQRNWSIYCCTPHDIYVDNHLPHAVLKKISFNNNNNTWYSVEQEINLNLANLDIILIRKDPPFDMEYIYLTYILERLQQNQNIHKPIIANNPTAIRNNNEKLSTLQFPTVTPPNLVTANKTKLLEFIEQHQQIIVKPLDGMGGHSIFKINFNDDNTSVILDTITQFGTKTILAQKFINEIYKGDKRILLVNGEPIPYGLARIPAKGEFRGNLAAGATGVGFELSERDKFICATVGSKLKEQGLYFVGIDVIGDYLTEINVTSPTCIQELDKAYNLNISKIYLDCLFELINN
jgi:glutathione synthase